MYKEKIVNVETGEITYRDYTEIEIAEIEKSLAENEAEAALKAEVQTAKAALLEKLGITEDEAKLLLS